MKKRQVIVIGAGTAGLIAAGRAAQLGASVILLEKMQQPGCKILLTGQSRCNLSHSGSIDDFISHYGSNGQFLYGVFNQFFRDDLLEMLNKYGITTREETDGRVFPASNRASDVVDSLKRYIAENNVDIRTGIKVTGLGTDSGHVIKVKTEQGFFPADAVILATGGASYPATGSEGDGYHIAGNAGHSIVKLRPALVPLVVKELGLAQSMQGVALRDARMTSYSCPGDDISLLLAPDKDIGRGIRSLSRAKPVIESRRGELLFTHFGLSGPIVLDMSLAIVDALGKGPVNISIDLKPGLKKEELHQQLQYEFAGHGSRTYKAIISSLLPTKMIEPFLDITNIPPDKRANQLNTLERQALVDRLKSLRFTVKEPLSLKTAMVTAGGVSLKEIDPRSMASRLVKGLYLCGEVIDIDGDSGGYNLQAAFSTGYVAGQHAANNVAQ